MLIISSVTEVSFCSRLYAVSVSVQQSCSLTVVRDLFYKEATEKIESAKCETVYLNVIVDCVLSLRTLFDTTSVVLCSTDIMLSRAFWSYLFTTKSDVQ